MLAGCMLLCAACTARYVSYVAYYIYMIRIRTVHELLQGDVSAATRSDALRPSGPRPARSNSLRQASWGPAALGLPGLEQRSGFCSERFYSAHCSSSKGTVARRDSRCTPAHLLGKRSASNGRPAPPASRPLLLRDGFHSKERWRQSLEV